jgi:excinuclease ABC subunit C
MVTFVNGRPEKSFYRKFKIRLGQKPNDPAMLGEVLIRRFRHTEWPFPDLILVDGGKTQLKTAQLAAKSYKLKIKIIALTKDKKHKGVKVYTSLKKAPIQLSNLSPALRNLILAIDDEAHRFAIYYHRKLMKIDLLPEL